MRVENGNVVEIAFTIKVQGRVVEEAPLTDPVAYMHGAGSLIPGVEEELEGLAEGETKSFTIPPNDAYGERDPDALVDVPRELFPVDTPLIPGTVVQARLHTGDIVPVTIVKTQDDLVRVDTNHPLAGKTLEFDVRVVSIRPVSTAELFTGRLQPIELV